jgi:general secretion pathway protein M
MSSKGKFSFLERLNINTVYNMFLGLPPQQQTIALVASIVAVVFIILLPISLASGKIGKMDKSLKKNREEMGSIVSEIDSYNDMRGKLRSMESSLEKGFDTTLSTTLENLASKEGIKENIESIKERPVVPSELFDESIVDVRISKVGLEQLINFLYSIEYDRSKLLRVKELRMRTRFDNRQLFDVSFQVSTYRLQREG